MSLIPPVRVIFRGVGLNGDCNYFPRQDIRGFKFGCAAREMLLSMPLIKIPPMYRNEFSDWFKIETPSQRKVVYRLHDAGLVWLCNFYEEGQTVKFDKIGALTPIGGMILDTFGDDMRNGNKIRWSKWKHDSVAASDDNFTKALNNMGLTEDHAIKLKRGVNKYASNSTMQSRGTSLFYLACRIDQYDRIWHNDISLAVKFSWDGDNDPTWRPSRYIPA